MNGTTKKSIGLGTVVALATAGVTAAMTAGYFKGSAETLITVNTSRVADNTTAIREQTKLFAGAIRDHKVKCDELHVQIWQTLSDQQGKAYEQFQAIQRELGGVESKIDMILKKMN